VKVILCFLLGIGIGIEIFYFVKEYSQVKSPTFNQRNVLSGQIVKPPSESPVIQMSITPILTGQSGSLSPTPKESFTRTPTKVLITQTPIPKIDVASSQEINGFIDLFAGQYGVNSNVLRHIAICESGFNPIATNGPYVGLYQFSAGTWNTYREKLGGNKNPDLRINAEEAVQTAAYIVSIGKSSIWPNCLP
jgi:hypothetical protein